MEMNAVRRITVETTETGTADATAKLVSLGKGYDDISNKSADAESASSKYEQALLRQQALFASAVQQQAAFSSALGQQVSNMQATAAANDNAARSGETFGSVMTKLALTAAAAALGIGALYAAFKILWAVVTAVPKLIGEAWDLGTQKLKEYTDLAVKASSLGVSTDFLQRMTRSAEDAKLPVETLTAALTRMQEALAPKLGGSDAIQQLDKLVSFGNFKGNTGITQLKNATTPDEQFQAALDFFKQATAASEKLAALDVMKTLFGADVASNLAKDSEYLDRIQAAAQRVSATNIISDDQISAAVQLQSRYDAAVKILEQRWHPIQEVLISLGIEMKSIWVGIVETIASAFDWIVKLVSQVGALWSGLKDLLAIMATGFPQAQGPLVGMTSSQIVDAQRANALQRLGVGLTNPAAVTAARDQTTRLSEQLRPDKSKAAAPEAPDTSAYDRATEAVLKYIEVTKAAAQAVDQGAGEQEKLKAIAQLTAAGMKDGLTPAAAAAKAEMSGLGEKAGAAADALARAKIASQIDFGLKTSLLSQGDLAIATQLKTVYGNDVTSALNSAEAAQLRFNAAAKETSSAIENSLVSGLTDIVSRTKSVGQGFTDMAAAVVKSIEQMVIKIMVVEPLMRALQGAVTGGFNLSGIGFNPIAGVSGHHAGGMVGSEPTFIRYVHPAYFDDAPRFHSGGIAGDEVPIIAKRGEGVFTP